MSARITVNNYESSVCLPFALPTRCTLLPIPPSYLSSCLFSPPKFLRYPCVVCLMLIHAQIPGSGAAIHRVATHIPGR